MTPRTAPLLGGVVALVGGNGLIAAFAPSDLPLRPALLYVDLYGELGSRLRYPIILDSPVSRRKCDAAGCIHLRGEADNASAARYLLLPVRGMRRARRCVHSGGCHHGKLRPGQLAPDERQPVARRKRCNRGRRGP